MRKYGTWKLNLPNFQSLPLNQKSSKDILCQLIQIKWWKLCENFFPCLAFLSILLKMIFLLHALFMGYIYRINRNEIWKTLHYLIKIRVNLPKMDFSRDVLTFSFGLYVEAQRYHNGRDNHNKPHEMAGHTKSLKHGVKLGLLEFHDKFGSHNGPWQKTSILFYIPIIPNNEDQCNLLQDIDSKTVRR